MSTADRLTATVGGYLPERGDPTWYVLGLSLALFVGFAVYQSVLYRGFWLTGADFGSYVHMFSSTLAGAGWLEQGKYAVRGLNSSYWGGHFSLTLLAFLPVYAVFPSPYTLIVCKAFALAASVPVFWTLARTYIESDRLAGLVTASYALNPFLWSAWLFDFQEQVLLPVLVFAAYYAYAERRYVAFLVLLALVLFTNEFMVLLTAGFLVGLAIVAYRTGRLRAEAPVLGVGAGILVAARLVSSWAISQHNPVSGLPVYVIAAPLQPFVEGSRVGIGHLFGVLLANPELLISSLSFHAFDKVVYLILLLVPVLFVAVVDEITVASLAPFVGFAWVFAGKSAYYTFGAHYPLYVLPFVYIGAVRVLSRVDISTAIETDNARASAHTVLSGLFALVLVANLAVGVAMGAQKNAVPTSDEHAATLDAAIDTVPPNATVLTQNDVYPHMASRENATFMVNRTVYYRYRRGHDRPTPEYILLDTTLETRSVDWSRLIRNVFAGRLGSEYGLHWYENGVWVFERGYDGPTRGVTGAYAVEPRTYRLRDFIPNEALVVGGRLVGRGGEAGTYYWYGPGAMLPPGNYTATFLVNATSSGRKPVANLEVAAGATPIPVANETVTNTNGTRNVTVRFTLDQMESSVEFRAKQAGGTGRFAFENVTVAPAGPAGSTGSRNATARRGESVG